MDKYDVVIIGGGPAGMGAGIECAKTGAKTLIIERENRLGGILNQCIHNGFGLHYFKEELTGPEYANRFEKLLCDTNVDVMLNTFVTKIDDKIEECDIIEKKCEEDKNKNYISKEKALTKALNGSLLIEEDVNSIEIRLNNYKVHNAYVVTFNKLDVQYRIEINCYTGNILSYSMNYSD